MGAGIALPGTASDQTLLVDPVYTASATLDTIPPENAVMQRSRFDLLLGGTRVAEMLIERPAPVPAAGCSGWPVMQYQTIGAAGGVPVRWNLGLPAGQVDAISFDSLTDLSSPDSLNLTIAIARAASSLDDDTASAFQGRPFIVRQAVRFPLAPGHDGVLAEVVRTVNQEANPLQEQLVLMVDGSWRSPDSTMRVTYRVRTAGLEETIPSVEFLAVVRSRRRQVLAIFLRREDANGWVLEMLERIASGHWVLRWRSAPSDC